MHPGGNPDGTKGALAVEHKNFAVTTRAGVSNDWAVC